MNNCRKCGSGYFVSDTNTNYCSNFCMNNDITFDLETRIEKLEEQVESQQKQINQLIDLIRNNNYND